MPMATQIKLLRVLEERKITRVGDNKEIDVNVRVLAATNQDLEAQVAAGKFRADLYYRLKIVSVHLDPLAERREDIIPLADRFRKMANQKHHKKTRENALVFFNSVSDFSGKAIFKLPMTVFLR